MMKFSKLLVSGMLFLFASTGILFAQEVSDEDLKSYAMLMDTLDVMKSNVNDEINEMIKSDELMQGGKRFLAIRKAKGDEAKLAELEVSEEELAAYDNIQKTKKDKVGNISSVFTELIKEGIGVSKYNEIKRSLKADAELKGKYKTMLADIKAKRAEEESK